MTRRLRNLRRNSTKNQPLKHTQKPYCTLTRCTVAPSLLFGSEFSFRPYFGALVDEDARLCLSKCEKPYFSRQFAPGKNLLFLFLLPFIWFHACQFFMRFKCFFTFSFSRSTCVSEYSDQFVAAPPSPLSAYNEKNFHRRSYFAFLFHLLLKSLLICF